jgi:hypothetical protein
MAVANVASKIQYPEGTEPMSMMYGQIAHYLCMGGKENTTNRTMSRLYFYFSF